LICDYLKLQNINDLKKLRIFFLRIMKYELFPAFLDRIYSLADVKYSFSRLIEV
jgi:hypothetical protein